MVGSLESGEPPNAQVQGVAPDETITWVGEVRHHDGEHPGLKVPEGGGRRQACLDLFAREGYNPLWHREVRGARQPLKTNWPVQAEREIAYPEVVVEKRVRCSRVHRVQDRKAHV